MEIGGWSGAKALLLGLENEICDDVWLQIENKRVGLHFVLNSYEVNHGMRWYLRLWKMKMLQGKCSVNQYRLARKSEKKKKANSNQM